MILRDWVWYNTESKSKYKIRYHLSKLKALWFFIFYINILNYRYFHTYCSTFLK